MTKKTSVAKQNEAKLLEMASNRSRSGRARLSTAIVEMFSEDAELFSSTDRELMTQIIIQLVDSAELSVKKAIAEKLASQPNIPRGLVVHFASMDAGVAHPILKNSPVLRDPDLINIVLNKTMEHQMAVSVRSIIPAPVSRVLAESEHDTVVRSLLENSGATIDEETFASLANRTTSDTIFSEALISRRDLPKKVVHQLYWAVSAALRQDLVENHGLEEDDIDDVMEEIVPDMIERINKEKEENGDISEQLATALKIGVLGKVLLSLVQSAQINTFTVWLAAASGLREELVSRIMFEEGGECLAAIFKALDIDRRDFLTIFVLLRQGRLGAKDVPKDEVHNVSDFYKDIKPDRADKFLKRLQRNPEYLNAIRLVKPGLS